MRVRKAVITAASPDHYALALQTMVDKDGAEKTALHLIIDEVIQAEIDELCLVIRPEDKNAYQDAAGHTRAKIAWVEQPEPRGYGDALFRAKDFVGADPFLHLVADHLYLSHTNACCAKQLIHVAQLESCAISAVQRTGESRLPYFGTVGGRRVANRSDLYELARVIEKPTPTQAEQELIVAGLRSGQYLCFFGMHVLTPLVMRVLQEQLEHAEDPKKIDLSAALNVLAQREKYLALEVQGARYNIGVKYGLLNAQLAFALAGSDRDQILTDLIELMALRRTTMAS